MVKEEEEEEVRSKRGLARIGRVYIGPLP